jgi:CDP-glucose 4,6-dehydratase
MSAFKPEVVLHMAAQPLVRLSYRDPVETYSTNVMGTVHLLEAARHCDSVRAIVNVTTDKCYDNREWVWGYREDDPWADTTPTAAARAALNWSAAPTACPSWPQGRRGPGHAPAPAT